MRSIHWQIAFWQKAHNLGEWCKNLAKFGKIWQNLAKFA